MGLVRLVLAYAATAGLFAWLAVRLRARPSLAAALALSLAPLVFTAGGFLPGRTLFDSGWLRLGAPWREGARLGLPIPPDRNALLFDVATQNEPWRAAARRDPLFSPATGAGASLIGNPQSAVLFPLELAGRAVPLPRAGTYLQAARLLVCGWGMFVLLRRRRLGESASLVGAWVLLGAGFLHFWRAQTPANVFACLPWLALALLAAWRRPSRRAAALVAVAGGAALLAGYPQTFAQATLSLGLLLLLLAPRAPRRLARGAAAAATGAVLALLLAAPVLLPFAELLPEAREWVHAGRAQRNPPPATLAESLASAAPAVLLETWGETRGGEWRHPFSVLELGQGWAPIAALALVPVALAGRRRRELWAWSAVGAVALAVGARFPGLYAAARELPLVSSTILGRWGFFWAFVLALLAAHGWQEAVRPRRAKVLALGAALASSLVVACLVAAPDRGAALPAAALALAGAALVPWLARRRALLPAAAPLAALLLLFPAAWQFSRWIPSTPIRAYYPQTPALELLERRSPGGRVAGLGDALLPHSAAFFGLDAVRAYDATMFEPYRRFLDLYFGAAYPGWAVLHDATHVLRFLNVRFVLADPDRDLTYSEIVYDGPEARVFELESPFERIFAPRRYRFETDTRRAERHLRGTTDLGELVFVHRPASAGEAVVERNGEATLADLEVGSGRLRCRVEARARTLLVATQPAIPGWRLWIDGEAAELVRVDLAFLGFWVPEGSHEIELRYLPGSLLLGVLCALAGGSIAVRLARPVRGSR